MCAKWSLFLCVFGLSPIKGEEDRKTCGSSKSEEEDQDKKKAFFHLYFSDT